MGGLVNAINELLMARARAAHAAASASYALTYIGATGIGGYQTPTNPSIAIPSGAVAGDLVLLLLNADNKLSWYPPTGSTDVIPGGSPYFVLEVRTYAWLYTLTASDISAGVVSFTNTANTNSWTVVGLFARGASTVNAYSPQEQQSTAYTIPGKTTTQPSLLVAMVCPYVYTGGITINPISGYTLGIDIANSGASAGRIHTAVYYNIQSAAGATGDISGTYSPSAPANDILFALA